MDIPVRSQHASLNLTPLVDMVFLLLMFFLLTTQFIEEDGIGVKLPTAASLMETEPDQVTVILTAPGEMYLEGQRLTEIELAPRLRKLMGQDTTVMLRGDRSVQLQHAITVMEQAKLAGAARIVVATEQEVPVP
jgi:biopolymer transport protein ExbD